MTDPDSSRRSWTDLDEDTQTALLIAFGRHLDTLPPTCSMATKEARLAAWLAARGIEYPVLQRRHQTTTGR